MRVTVPSEAAAKPGTASVGTAAATSLAPPASSISARVKQLVEERRTRRVAEQCAELGQITQRNEPAGGIAWNVGELFLGKALEEAPGFRLAARLRERQRERCRPAGGSATRKQPCGS